MPQLRPAQKAHHLAEPGYVAHIRAHAICFGTPTSRATSRSPTAIRPCRARRMMFDPGSKWAAIGGSLDRVGRLVEIAGGKPLDRYFHDHICAPLGMEDTVFVVSDQQRARQGLATAFAQGGRDFRCATGREANATKEAFSGGTAASIRPRRITSPLLPGALERWEPGWKKHPAAGNGCADDVGQPDRQYRSRCIMKTTNPALSNDVDFFPGTRLRWGLGHMINLDPVREVPQAPAWPDMGRSLQHLLLDRSSVRYRGGDHDAGPAVRRHPRTQRLSPVRACGFTAGSGRFEIPAPRATCRRRAFASRRVGHGRRGAARLGPCASPSFTP